MEKVSRRLFLEVGSAAAFSSLLPGRVQAETTSKLRPLVVLCQAGAQSAFEFIEPLVKAPAEMRGGAEAIRATNGELIDSRWPKFASVADKTAVIKSIDAKNVAHEAVHVFGNPAEAADILASDGVPYPFIEPPSKIRAAVKYLGMEAAAGMQIQWNYGKDRFTPPYMRHRPELGGRMALLKTLDQSVMTGGKVERMERNRELAAKLLLDGKTLQQPFKDAEQDIIRYGNHPIGDACALASHFAQSGAGISFIYNEYDKGWDMHENMKEGNDAMIPPTDHAIRELILDARRHGFTLLITTEHGRDPKLNDKGGREHAAPSFAILAGHGVREGAVIGNFTRFGDFGSEKLDAAKVMPTALQACGMEHENKSAFISDALK